MFEREGNALWQLRPAYLSTQPVKTVMCPSYLNNGNCLRGTDGGRAGVEDQLAPLLQGSSPRALACVGTLVGIGNNSLFTGTTT